MPRLRLSRILRDEIERCGSVVQLAKSIERANQGRLKLDRRKLSAIADGNEDFSLKRQDIFAIEAYLTTVGTSLTEHPILENCGVVNEYSKHDQVACFVACAEGGTEDTPRCSAGIWDFRSYSHVARQIKAVCNAHLPLYEIERLSMSKLAVMPPSQRVNRARSLLANRSSVCSVGALFVSHLSEYMLAEMLGVSPFEAPTAASTLVPILFVCYPPKNQPEFRVASRFSIAANDLRHTELSSGANSQDVVEKIQSGDARAIVVNKQVLPILFREKTYFDYGVIAAQIRPDGKLWTVVFGMSGPGTCAAAERLSDVLVELEPSSQDELRTVIAVVKAPVERMVDDATDSGPNLSPEDRVLGEGEFLFEPIIYTTPVETRIRKKAAA